VKIGIIGSGNIGGTAARLFHAAGHEVALSNSRGPASLEDEVAEIGPGAHAESVEGAARFGDVVLEAIPFHAYDSLPAQALAGKIVITASNYYANRDGRMDFDGLTESERVARHLGESRVVKAFNTIYWVHLRDQGDAEAPVEERRVVPLAGDDEEAKAVVAELIEEIGFAPLDMGGLRDGGRRMQPGRPIYNEDLTRAEAEELLSTHQGDEG